ncbi:MAG: AAA family ATPase [Bacteroidetes bacterium]|nr:AAA family ATPase [Bacteroidota bacterium]
MLQRLSIKNYAIIESVDLDFDSGFNIITGETGAGKSILMGALGLILGKRADTSVLETLKKNAILRPLLVLAV